ncbi:MAG: alpha-amylase family glycosyl hydrolase [Vicinamibacterales bacterium]
MFEISAWPWLERLSREHGRTLTLGQVPETQWDALAARGFHIVYLMGVWRRSAIGRQMARSDPGLMMEFDRTLPGWTVEDVPGSPYSIGAYEPDPRLGGWRDLEVTRRRLHARGIALVVDFVPNHTGFDHPWVDSHPDRYVTGSLADFRANPRAFKLIETRAGGPRYIACGRDPFFPPWSDVAQLDYSNPDTRAAMIVQLQVIGEHCDGVRCDMAMLALNDVFAGTWGHLVRRPSPDAEFWSDATAALPAFLFLAEVYWDLEWRLQRLGFSFTYDKRLRDRLLHESAQSVRGHLRADLSYQARLARFLDNHDEPRSLEEFGRGRLEAAAVTCGTTPGMRFYYDGQLEGRRLRAPVQLARWADEPRHPEIEELYARLLGATRDRVFHDGDWALLELRPAGDDSSSHLIAWRWRLDADLRVIVVNLSASSAQGNVLLGGEISPDGPPSVLAADLMGGGRYTWDRGPLRDRGLYVRLDGGRAHLFEVS